MVLPFLLWGASTVWSPNGMAFGQIREWLQWGAISVCIITSNVSGLHPTLLRLGEVRCSSDNTLTSSQGVGSTVVEHEKDAPIIMSSPTQYARGAPFTTQHSMLPMGEKMGWGIYILYIEEWSGRTTPLALHACIVKRCLKIAGQNSECCILLQIMCVCLFENRAKQTGDI